MPNQPKTPARNVRIDDDLWRAAQDKAAANGVTLSVVIRLLLARWVAG